MKLYVKYTESGYSWSENHGHGDWDYSWGAEYHFEVHGVYCDPQPSNWKFNEEIIDVNFDFKSGDVVYVLTMIYSTGDTFGGSTGNGEVLWVFKDIECAKRAGQAIRDNEESYSIDIIDETGKHVQLSNPGFGYFECIEQILLESFVVDEGSERVWEF